MLKSTYDDLTNCSLSDWTTGMEIYPLSPSFLELVPAPLLAGVLGGVCFLFMAIVLSLVTACYMRNWRERRRRKRQQGKTRLMNRI